MRKIAIWIVIFSTFLSGCEIKKTYSPAQPESNIAQIEIVNINRWFEYTPGSDYDFEVVCEITEENYSAFLEGLRNVPCCSYYGSPYNGFMEDTIRITFSDGAFELVGEKSVYYETSEGEWTYPSYDLEQEAYKNFLSSWKAVYSYRG